MSRDVRVYLDDMVEHATRALTYVVGYSLDDLIAEPVTLDAVILNVQIVGEAAKHVPAHVRGLAPDLPWRQAAALRDRLVHKYYDVDPAVLWTVVSQELAPLRDGVAALLLRLDLEEDRPAS